jgi:AraC family transcriptional regulator
MLGSADLRLVQGDGGPPTILAAGSAPGESGVSVLSVRFHNGVRFTATPKRHIVFFQMAQQARFACRISGRALTHEPSAGSLAICPAGADSAADAEGGLDAILIMINPGHLALAAAEGSALEAQLTERLSGYDQMLLGLARALAVECASDYLNGSLYWNELAGAFVSGLVARHTSELEPRARGKLGKAVLEQLRDYIVAHLDEQIDVGSLARIAGRSPFHFSRVFTRSVGMTPHRYVVHLRLRRAIALVREGRSGLAEIAACTGFADQSHLSRWARRVHGVPLTQLAS